MKRFEFVEGDEIVIAPGRTVKRIRALIAIAALGVASGDLGGYIEKDAQVSGDAWVFGDAHTMNAFSTNIGCWLRWRFLVLQQPEWRSTKC